MKKSYVKPQMYFESFQLSASIAAGCTFKANAAENVCAFKDPDFGMIFTDSVEACKITPPSGNDKVCYHAPSGNNVFTS